ncbi:MAG: PaaI family thioesterase [Bacteroidales bacterium]|nr:PaaI family thioesterase [Bacteroidales bacterium]MBN2818152.1 PaaI family thioesterase [Bacteroidales bacterium]
MSHKIINPFAVLDRGERYNCFGCSPNNALGLQLHFQDCGENEIESFWQPQKHLEGFFNVLHGGIQATLHDEVAGWIVFTKCKTSGVTQNLNVKYLKPVFINGPKIRIAGKLIEIKDKTAIIKTGIYNSEGQLCSEGEVEYFVFPEAVAKKRHFYPGVEAFYEG